MKPFDFHTHTCMSDGTDSPRELVANACAAGLELVAVTDHDTMRGTRDAVLEGKRLGIGVIPGIELDVECEESALHILGLGCDINNETFSKAIERAGEWRSIRNARMLQKLDELGLSIRDAITEGEGTFTRLHMAKAMVAKGYVETKSEAFDKYLKKGRPAYARCENIKRRDAIDIIHTAGGIAVLAHPCKMQCDTHSLINELVSYGLDGIEAYYPSSTDGQRELYISLARQNGLYISAGSDYHGVNRKSVTLGCAYRDDAALQPIYDRIRNML